MYCIAYLILLLSLVRSQAPETTHSCVRLIGLIVRLLRPLRWHFAVALGPALWLSYRHAVWAALSSVQHTVYAKVLFTLHYPFGCTILHSCYQLSKLIPVVLLEFFVFLLAQSPKAFQDTHSEPKEVGFLSQDYSCSVWCNVKSWLYK